MKNFHVTFYYDRNEPLLGGHTVEADSIVNAIGKFLLETEIDVQEIKYIVEV
jgi:hypothetical protein